MNDIYYYGCFKDKGHHLFAPQGGQVRELSLPYGFPVPLPTLDGGLLPVTGREIEGMATVAHVNGWTILSFWDRSIDTRPGSSSTFVMLGTLDYAEARDVATKAFPSIWARFKFSVQPRIAEVPQCPK